MIKKRVFCVTAVLIGLLTLFACGQEAIFFTIASETAPKKPRIDGAPSNMVVLNRAPIGGGTTAPVMYVASSKRLFWYAKEPAPGVTSGWNLPAYETKQPGGKIRSLAVVGTDLYALCDTGLFKFIVSSNTWSPPISSDAAGEYPNIQNIFADANSTQLFAGANNGSKYGILYLDTSSKLQVLARDTELLSGYAYNSSNHYLSTRGKGVYTFTGTPPSTVTQIENKNLLIMGMIKINSTVFAIERDGGTLYKVTPTALSPAGVSGANVATGKWATGALALYNDGTNNILVAGKQGALFNTSSSYTHGYVEFEIKSGDTLEGPKEPTYTVRNLNQYTSSIGKRPINYLYQPIPAIDPADMLFFASTQTTGLWSYRFKDGVWQWNAED